MKIQVNTDNNVHGSAELSEFLSSVLAKELDRFKDQITRLEVHLSDEDGSKDGQDDKRCLLEARLEGMNPVAVTNLSNTDEKAVKGAADKLKALLTTILGKARRY